MKYMIAIFCLLGLVLMYDQALAQKKNNVQKINFDETDVSGKVRQPDGSYIVQKRGIEFVPLYKLKENFDQQIEESIEYIK